MIIRACKSDEQIRLETLRATRSEIKTESQILESKTLFSSIVHDIQAGYSSSHNVLPALNLYHSNPTN